MKFRKSPRPSKASVRRTGKRPHRKYRGERFSIERWQNWYNSLSAVEREREDARIAEKKRAAKAAKAERLERKEQERYGETEPEWMERRLLDDGQISGNRACDKSIDRCANLGRRFRKSSRDTRAAHRRALEAVYNHWVNVANLDYFVERTVDWCKTRGFKATKRTHPVLALIKAAVYRRGKSARRDTAADKSASRDARALRWAIVNKVPGSKVGNFLRKEGLDRGAKRFAEHQQTQKAKERQRESDELKAYLGLPKTDLEREPDPEPQWVGGPRVVWKPSALKKLKRLADKGYVLGVSAKLDIANHRRKRVLVVVSVKEWARTRKHDEKSDRPESSEPEQSETDSTRSRVS